MIRKFIPKKKLVKTVVYGMNGKKDKDFKKKLLTLRK